MMMVTATITVVGVPFHVDGHVTVKETKRTVRPAGIMVVVVMVAAAVTVVSVPLHVDGHVTVKETESSMRSVTASDKEDDYQSNSENR